MIRSNARESSLDLLWVIGAMLPAIWLLRPVSIVFAGPVGLFVAVAIATWRFKARGLTWKDVGVARPQSLLKSAEATVVVFVLAIVLSNAATIMFRSAGLVQTSPDVDHLEGVEGNALYFLFRLGLAWATTFCEEFVFRGLLISRLDRIFGGTRLATILAVALQACLFGYLHYATQGLSGVFTAGSQGLAMGIGYVVFNRNLWPLVVVHVALNTIALSEVFLGP